MRRRIASIGQTHQSGRNTVQRRYITTGLVRTGACWSISHDRIGLGVLKMGIHEDSIHECQKAICSSADRSQSHWSIRESHYLTGRMYRLAIDMSVTEETSFVLAQVAQTTGNSEPSKTVCRHLA